MGFWQSHWGIAQWTAYFENQALPVMARSKRMLAALEAESGDLLSPKDLSDIVLQDPLLCLCLLRAAEIRKSHRLDHKTTTALAAILQLGVDEFRKLLLASPEVDEANEGLLKVENRGRIAAQIASTWAAGRMDLNPEEVAVAALLAGTGELLLWAYADELPRRAEEMLQLKRARRSAEAQMQACGFTFRQLTLQCVERWKLPGLLLQLLGGANSLRAQLTRISSNAARHVLDESETSTLALACDLVDASRLIPGGGLEWLVAGLPELPEERRPLLLATAREVLSASAS
jgi:HD-like signal output (HDOD) protein